MVFFTQRLIKKSLPRGCFPWSFANYLVEHMEVHTTMKIISRSTGKPINLNNSLELGYSRYLLAQSQQWKYQNNMWNISKLNNVVLVSLLLTLNRFVHIACVLPLLTLNQQMTAGSISLLFLYIILNKYYPAMCISYKQIYKKVNGMVWYARGICILSSQKSA